MSDYPEPTQWNGAEVWSDWDGGGEVLQGVARFNADISLLLLCLATKDDLARFWAMQALRSARVCGLLRSEP